MKLLRNFFMIAALIAIPAFGQELTSDITGVVTNNETGQPIQDVIYKVDEIFTSILDDRKTDSFGRYRWLLSSDDYSKHVSFMHWDYEPLLSQDFNISSSSIIIKLSFLVYLNSQKSGKSLNILFRITELLSITFM